jgi:hypothetical protein
MRDGTILVFTLLRLRNSRVLQAPEFFVQKVLSIVCSLAEALG